MSPRQASTSPNDQGATTPTFLVAAQDASARVRRTADFVCDGSRTDDVELQAAYDALPSGGGHLVLSEGGFTLAASFIIAAGKPLTLTGQGQGVTTLTLANGVNDHAIKAAGAMSHCQFRDFTIDGNKANQTGGGGLELGGHTDVVVREVEAKNCKTGGIGATSGSVIIRGTFLLCYSHDNDGTGFFVGYNSFDVRFISCVSKDNGAHGFAIDGSTDIMALACIADGNGTHGFDLLGDTRALIIGCVIINNTGTGIEEYISSVGNVFVANTLNGNGTPVADLGALARHNQGYVTEKSGTATLLNGQTSVVVNHGLDVLPTAGAIMVTPIEAWGAMTEFYIDTYTSTQFTIHADQNPTQDVDFAWRAAVL